MSSAPVGLSGQRVRYLTLHRNPERRVYFASRRAGIQFDPVLKGWVVDDPALVAELITDARLAVVDYLGHLIRARRHGVPLDNLIFLARFMPLFQEGEGHSNRRREVASFLGDRRTHLLATLPASVSNRLRPLFDVGTVEVMSEVLVPLLDDIGNAILGIHPGKLRVHRLSAVLDRFQGNHRVERLDAEVGEVRAAIRGELGFDEVREGLVLVLLVLSHDTLLGTLGQSLHQIFLGADGVPIRETAIPVLPSETGVPFVEREVRQAINVRGRRLKTNDRVRLMLQGLAYSADPADHARIFGVGRHLCLGKRLAIDVWTLIAAELARLNRTITVVDYAPRTIDLVFACPARLTVRVS